MIDQHKDGLDFNVVLREVIPRLHKVNSKRQLTMSSPNASPPVNGAVKQVSAVGARDRKGEALACSGG